MIPRSVAVALLAWVAAAPAAAYERSRANVTRKPLFWPATTIAWHLNREWAHTARSCDATAGGDPTLEAALASFAEWEQPCSEIELVYAGTLQETRVGFYGSDENVVVFRDGFCSQHPQAKIHPCLNDPELDCGGLFNCFEDGCQRDAVSCANWSIVALTSVLHDPSTGRIVDADIEVNGWDGTFGTIGSTARRGWYFTCFDQQPSTACTTYDQQDCHYIDLQNTLTHEVGHFIGLAHPCGQEGVPQCTPLPPTAVPYDQTTMHKDTLTGEIIKRSLSSDDVAGVCEVYPATDGGCGCGSGGAGGALALLLGALALRRRRAGAP